MKLTNFEKDVLRYVLTIPLGQTRTYKQVALAINRPRAYRAVGSVLRKNAFPLIIPCHRVIRSGGDLGKYSFSKISKKELINLEKKIKNVLK